jgi:hypothetical protein
VRHAGYATLTSSDPLRSLAAWPATDRFAALAEDQGRVLQRQDATPRRRSGSQITTDLTGQRPAAMISESAPNRRSGSASC